LNLSALRYRPFSTLLGGGVSLSNVFTFFFHYGFTIYGIIVNNMFMVSRRTGRCIFGRTNFGARSVTIFNKRGVTKLNLFLASLGFELNKTIFLKVLLTFLVLDVIRQG
jgi:hypothetical protein